jgi:hypothetical protein
MRSESAIRRTLARRVADAHLAIGDDRLPRRKLSPRRASVPVEQRGSGRPAHCATMDSSSPSPDLVARVEALLETPLRASFAQLYQLEGEVLALVAAHAPEIDLARVQRRRADFNPY